MFIPGRFLKKQLNSSPPGKPVGAEPLEKTEFKEKFAPYLM
jgi:hypothetical protein